jgi:uncharacterized protein YehS (DUF1456 family)
MTRNDLLRRLRYALDLSDARMLSLVALGGGPEVPRASLAAWLARDDDPAFAALPDPVFAAFLDGLVLDRRGPRDPSQPAPPAGPARLDNNAILKKLRIALELQEQDLLGLLRAGGLTLSASELGALFRKPGHKHYRACGDQVLRTLVAGLTQRLRPGAS